VVYGIGSSLMGRVGIDRLFWFKKPKIEDYPKNGYKLGFFAQTLEKSGREYKITRSELLRPLH